MVASNKTMNLKSLCDKKQRTLKKTMRKNKKKKSFLVLESFEPNDDSKIRYKTIPQIEVIKILKGDMSKKSFKITLSLHIKKKQVKKKVELIIPRPWTSPGYRKTFYESR